MRSYLIDDVSMENCQKLQEHLIQLDLQATLPGVFWFTVPQEFFTQEQDAHATDCGPHVMALEIEEHKGLVRLEFLVRAKNALHCSCVGYASPALIQHMISRVDEIFAQLSIDI